MGLRARLLIGVVLLMATVAFIGSIALLRAERHWIDSEFDPGLAHAGRAVEVYLEGREFQVQRAGQWATGSTSHATATKRCSSCSTATTP